MSNNAQIEPQVLATTAFGEAQVAQLKPVLQVTAQYGLRDDVLIAVLGGTASSVDSKFVVSTGVGAGNVAAIVSERQATYRAGQGLLARFTALFTEGAANSLQSAGFITSESGFAFGYNGTEFGIAHSRGGSLEQQELQVTVSGSGNVDITVDGNIYTVALTAGSPEHNAYEISVSLASQVPGYNFSSADDIVEMLALLPDFGAGTFSYSPLASGSTAIFTEISNGVIMTDDWTPKAEWNVNPNIDIDPTLGNVYQIQLQYLGFGGIKFFVENPETALFELVHIIRYANTSTIPIVSNPIFRIGWAARNTGNTTDIVVQGASGAGFVEGDIFFDGDKRGFGFNQSAIGGTLTSILSIQNRLTYFGTANRAEILLKALSLSTDTTKTAQFQIIKNPVIASGQSLEFETLSTNDLAQVSTTASTVIGGDELAAFNVKSQGSFMADIENTVSALLPGDILCVAANVSSGSASEMGAALTWQDDL